MSKTIKIDSAKLESGTDKLLMLKQIHGDSPLGNALADVLTTLSEGIGETAYELDPDHALKRFR